MAKRRSTFQCISCGFDFVKWSGRCPNCKEWNSLVEVDSLPSIAGKETEVVSLSTIHLDDLKRVKTGIEEFNLVCGDGIVPGSIILIGGEPGIGKSTLALQISHFFNTLYISGEESPVQIRHRAERLEIKIENIFVSTNTMVKDIIKIIESKKPDCVIIDSVQTLYSSEVPGSVGSVSQIKESTLRLVEVAKRTGIPIMLIGHITKEGSIAGPKILEHIVDTVLYFEGDFSKEFRILRSFKNRFGSVNEIGLFRMTEKGLMEVKNRNSMFLNSFSSNSPGSAISAAIEGSRSILFEVQSLVTYSSFSNPRRMSDGFDLNRLIIIIAVLEKHALLKLNSFDVFINVAGGFQITETSADLAVAMSIASSLKDQPIPQNIGFLGEISLSGEVRPVSQCQRRIHEFQHSGIKTIILSNRDSKDKMYDFKGDLIGIQNVSEAMDHI